MKIKLTGTSFRDNRFELLVGTELHISPDPCGEVTGEKHKDKNALSVWMHPQLEGFNFENYTKNFLKRPEIEKDKYFGPEFLGYIPKDLTHNKFNKVVVSQVWYKSPKKSVQGVTSTYSEGDIIAGIECECEGEFQITEESGRHYEIDGEEYTSITTLLKKYPSDPDSLIRWATENYNSYDEYKEGLDGYAESGTDMHNKIEEFLKIRKDDRLDYKASIEWVSLPENVKNFFDKLGDFEVISIESRVKDDNLKLAGTCDAVLLVNGKKIAFDWKSSSKVQTKHKIQSGFYGKCMDCDLAAVVCFGVNNKQRYSVSKVNIENAYKCLTLFSETLKMEKNLTYKN